MPAANPFIGGMGAYPAPTAAATPPVSADTTGGLMSAAIGTGSLTAPHNCPIHVAALIIAALAVVFILRALGFRFSVDAGVGR